MRLLGLQYYNRMKNPESDAGLNEIFTAHKNNDIFLTADSMLDAYMWGFICGQRAERKRKAEKIK